MKKTRPALWVLCPRIVSVAVSSRERMAVEKEPELKHVEGTVEHTLIKWLMYSEYTSTDFQELQALRESQTS